MKKIGIIVLLGVALAIAGCGQESTETTTNAPKVSEDGRKVLFYRSGMDPSFISTSPGKDTMGMDLVPVYEGDPGADLDTITVDGATIQKMGVRVEKVKKDKLTRIVRAVGRVELDETRVSKINMKFDGWIEKLLVNETGQFVKRGQALFKVYSPELLASQQEYLQVRKSLPPGPTGQRFLNSAKQRLLQFDVPKSFVRAIEKSGKARRTVTVRAPASGYVVHKTAFAGTQVKEGANLFTIADVDALWIIADVFELDAPWIAVGQDATIELDYLPGNSQTAKVDYIYPTLNEKTRTLKVRLIIPNPAIVLKPGMFATVRIHTQPAGESVVVPNDAVIHSGEHHVAFVSKGQGRFEPRNLRLGVKGDDAYQVLSGLSEGEDVVVSGQFLLDSESRLKEAVKKMLGGNLSYGKKVDEPMPTMPNMPSMKAPDAGADAESDQEGEE